jgi:hypothetical protein
MNAPGRCCKPNGRRHASFQGCSQRGAFAPAVSADEIDLEARALPYRVARLGREPPHAGGVDADQVAAPLFHFAGHEHGVDICGIHDVDAALGALLSGQTVIFRCATLAARRYRSNRDHFLIRRSPRNPARFGVEHPSHPRT